MIVEVLLSFYSSVFCLFCLLSYSDVSMSGSVAQWGLGDPTEILEGIPDDLLSICVSAAVPLTTVFPT